MSEAKIPNKAKAEKPFDIARADGDASQTKDATALFDNMYLTYRRYVNRTRMPKTQLRAFLI